MPGALATVRELHPTRPVHPKTDHYMRMFPDTPVDVLDAMLWDGVIR